MRCLASSCPPAGRGDNRGFTLIELMVTIALIVIFTTLAGPSFRQLIAQQRVKSASSALVESLWLARSQAIKLNANVSLKFVNGGANSPVSPWDITQSSDGSGASLHHQDGFPAITSQTSSGGDMLFVYSPLGRLAPTSVGTITLKASTVCRQVSVTSTGRASAQDVTCP